MKTQEFIHDLTMERFSMSENLLVASELLLDGHVIEYGRHFEKLNNVRHKYRF